MIKVRMPKMNIVIVFIGSLYLCSVVTSRDIRTPNRRSTDEALDLSNIDPAPRQGKHTDDGPTEPRDGKNQFGSQPQYQNQPVAQFQTQPVDQFQTQAVPQSQDQGPQYSETSPRGFGNSIRYGVKGAGSFIAKATEVLEDIDTFAQFAKIGADETIEAKQTLLKEKGETANTLLGIGQEVGQVTLPIITSLLTGLKSMIKYKTNLLRSFNQIRNRPPYKAEEDDLDLAFLLG